MENERYSSISFYMAFGTFFLLLATALTPYIEVNGVADLDWLSFEFSNQLYSFFSCVSAVGGFVIASIVIYCVTYALLHIANRVAIAFRYSKPQRIYEGDKV